jgi:hypothetical protein
VTLEPERDTHPTDGPCDMNMRAAPCHFAHLFTGLMGEPPLSGPVNTNGLMLEALRWCSRPGVP